MTRSVLSVLVIEDEPVLAKNIRAYLVRYGYEVRVAMTAEAGLEELEGFKPDIILLDFNLPGMNGLEALERIRAIHGGIKVIMMTAYGTGDLAERAMRAGACQFVTKPVSVVKLKQLLDEAVVDEPRDLEL
jgi:two-component system, NtrC family, response regulator AtoC